MMYKFLKKVHPISFTLACVTIFGCIGTSDLYIRELNTPATETAESGFIWVIILLIPTVLKKTIDFIKII